MEPTSNKPLAATPASTAVPPQSVNPANSPEQQLADSKKTRSRIPMSVPRPKLSTPEIPGYHVHWINDYVGRIAQAVQGGYEFVDQSEALITMPDLAGASLGKGTDLGSRVSVVVGRGEDGAPLRAYLMKIRQEWFDEDQKAGQERVDAVHEALRRGAQKNPTDSPEDAALRYVKRVRMTSTYSRKDS